MVDLRQRGLDEGVVWVGLSGLLEQGFQEQGVLGHPLHGEEEEGVDIKLPALLFHQHLFQVVAHVDVVIIGPPHFSHRPLLVSTVLGVGLKKGSLRDGGNARKKKKKKKRSR